MKNYKTFYENIILNSITLDVYDIDNGTDIENIKNVFKIFKNEYGFCIYQEKQKLINENLPSFVKDHISNVNAFREWVQGLPSVLTVPFYNNDILDLAYLNGLIPANANEEIENDFLNSYFNRLTEAFFTLLNNL